MKPDQTGLLYANLSARPPISSFISGLRPPALEGKEVTPAAVNTSLQDNG